MIGLVRINQVYTEFTIQKIMFNFNLIRSNLNCLMHADRKWPEVFAFRAVPYTQRCSVVQRVVPCGIRRRIMYLDDRGGYVNVSDVEDVERLYYLEYKEDYEEEVGEDE